MHGQEKQQAGKELIQKNGETAMSTLTIIRHLSHCKNKLFSYSCKKKPYISMIWNNYFVVATELGKVKKIRIIQMQL